MVEVGNVWWLMNMNLWPAGRVGRPGRWLLGRAVAGPGPVTARPGYRAGWRLGRAARRRPSSGPANRDGIECVRDNWWVAAIQYIMMRIVIELFGADCEMPVGLTPSLVCFLRAVALQASTCHRRSPASKRAAGRWRASTGCRWRWAATIWAPSGSAASTTRPSSINRLPPTSTSTSTVTSSLHHLFSSNIFHFRFLFFLNIWHWHLSFSSFLPFFLSFQIYLHVNIHLLLFFDQLFICWIDCVQNFFCCQIWLKYFAFFVTIIFGFNVD